MTDMKTMPRIPRTAVGLGVPVRGTLILILWQKAFPWPTWVYAIIWTLWVLFSVVVIVDMWTARHITEQAWRAVWK